MENQKTQNELILASTEQIKKYLPTHPDAEFIKNVLESLARLKTLASDKEVMSAILDTEKLLNDALELKE